MKKIKINALLFYGFLSIFYVKGQIIKEGSRQIHLDFHTSGLIKNIGEDFSKAQFQEALKIGNVNSINLFAKGHHGYSYYNTNVGTRHPHLKFDLLKEQIEACHELGITTQVYFTVGWSQKDADEHPEWILKNKNGTTDKLETLKKLGPNDKLPNFTWRLLAPSNGYDELILDQVEEICKNYQIDGFWFDILQAYPNYSESNKALMKKDGVDLNNDKEVLDYSINQMKSFMERCNKLVHSYKPNIPIYYNGVTNIKRANNLRYNLFDFNTKQDLEDLPTTWDGYDIFPFRSKFFAADGKQIVAMSGKFHSSWGEFGGFKHKDALLYEAASMVAFGANVNIGDQLHPSGKMDLETYRNIGHAFDYVEKIEEYGIGGKHISNIGYYYPFNVRSGEGTARMLLENQINFNVINRLDDWSELETIIIPSATKLNNKIVSKLNSFLGRGGKLLIMGKSILKNNSELWFDIGAQYIGQPKYDIDYTVINQKLNGNDLVESPFLNYNAAHRFKVQDAEILASIKEPYFSRTPASFSSHQNTPYKLQDSEHSAIFRKENIIYIAHNLDVMYFSSGARIHRDLFKEVLDIFHKNPLVKVDLQSSGRINLLHQPEKSRYVLHLLYATPIQRGRAQVIEDLVPIYDTDVQINLKKNIKKVFTVPGNKKLKIKKRNEKTFVRIPKFKAHVALVIEY